MKQAILICFLVYLSMTGTHVNAQCVRQNNTFKSGERISYSLSYQWGFFWVKAGIVRFSVDSTVVNGLPVYQLVCNGGSRPSFEWLFEVREDFRSMVRADSLIPLEFTRSSREMGYKKHNHITFDHQQGLVQTTVNTSDLKSSFKELDLASCAQDVILAAYQLRNIDFEKLNAGDSLQVKTIIDNRYYNFTIFIKGRETARDAMRNSYACIRLTALLDEGTLFNKGESLSIWVTDDSNHIPVKAEASILVGKVKAYLEFVENLKYPLKALNTK